MRQFLAVELPGAVRERLGHWIAAHADAHGGWRWVRPNGIHVTLRFLGNEVAAATDTVARPAWREVARGEKPFGVRTAGIAGFPNPRRPRVLVVALEDTRDGAMCRLARRIEGAARAVGFPAETRVFRPHLTLGRAARGNRAVLPDAPAPSEESIDVTCVSLVQSTLTPSGARYTVLDTYPLGG